MLCSKQLVLTMALMIADGTAAADVKGCRKHLTDPPLNDTSIEVPKQGDQCPLNRSSSNGLFNVDITGCNTCVDENCKVKNAIAGANADEGKLSVKCACEETEPEADTPAVPYVPEVSEIEEADEPAVPSASEVPPAQESQDPTNSSTVQQAPWTKKDTVSGAYNLILTDFDCHNSQNEWTAKNHCRNLLAGEFLPDHNEKFQMMQAEITRMFPIDFKNSIYVGEFEYANDGPTPEKCGNAQESPLYLSHNAAEGARYFAKSIAQCTNSSQSDHRTCEINESSEKDCAWFKKDGEMQYSSESGKDTCKANDCELFKKDGEVTRSEQGYCLGRMGAFVSTPRTGLVNQESICEDVEKCVKYDVLHCKVLFNPERHFFAIGSFDGGRMIVSGWNNKDANKRYALAMGSHFNRNARAKRSIITGDDTAALMFQTVYYDADKKPVSDGYVVYQGKRHSMTNILSRNGEKWRSIYELEVSDLPTTCEPYYFYFELEDGTSIRLPEDPRYMYGTAGLGECKENHYFDTTGTQVFAANAGPSVVAPAYKAPGLTGNDCAGCTKIILIDAENPGDLEVAL